MRVLVACEYSGRVRDAFLAQGADAISADLEATEVPGPHYRGDVRDILGDGWDLLVGFPPCTYLTTVGAAWWPMYQADGRQPAALRFVVDLLSAPVPRIAVENPAGLINTAVRLPDQIIQPWQFGDPWIKRTCLWLENLPRLVPGPVVDAEGRHWVDGGTRLTNPEREFGDHLFGSGTDDLRKTQRSRTFPGIAAAMAAQWSGPDVGDGGLFPVTGYRRYALG